MPVVRGISSKSHGTRSLVVASWATLAVLMAASRAALPEDVHDPKFYTTLRNGESLARQHRFNEAIASYTRAVKIPHGDGADHSRLLSDLEMALSQMSRNADGHIALGQALEQWHLYSQAQAEYRQAISVSPGYRNATAEMLLADGRLKKLIRDMEIGPDSLEWMRELDRFQILLTTDWRPPLRTHHLMTRCWMWIEPEKPVPDVKVVVSSGSSEHDHSAIELLRNAPFPKFKLLPWGLYHCVCMSDGKLKRVELWNEGHATRMPTLPNEPADTRPLKVPSWMLPVAR
jgi:hypothetical protein